MKIKWFLFLVLSVASLEASAVEVVKKSTSGICHSSSSKWYEKTTHFTAYSSIAKCIASGGRLPKVSSHSIKTPANNKNGTAKYNRHDYAHWIDSDNDGLNTRHELLEKMSLSNVTYNSKHTLVLKGKWYGAYSNKYYYVTKDLDIDHIVPLAWAHSHGAYKWSKSKKAKFANSESNLIPVEKSLNRAKGAQSPATWLPPYKPYRCQYVIRFDRLVKQWGLTYFSNEKRIIDKMIRQCASSR